MTITEHGAPMAATILNSPRAVDVSIYVVRAFVRLRELAASHGDLAKRLDDLEQKTETLAMNHDTFSRNTRNQLKGQGQEGVRDGKTQGVNRGRSAKRRRLWVASHRQRLRSQPFTLPRWLDPAC